MSGKDMLWIPPDLPPNSTIRRGPLVKSTTNSQGLSVGDHPKPMAVPRKASRVSGQGSLASRSAHAMKSSALSGFMIPPRIKRPSLLPPAPAYPDLPAFYS